MRGRLSTLDRLASFGITQTLTCPLCLRENECLDHILFSCQFANQIWHLLFGKCNLPCPYLCWGDLLQDVATRFKGKSLETLLSDLCWLLASISSGKRGILGCFLGRTEMSPACFRTLCCMLDSERVLSLVFRLLLLIGVLLILGLSLKISYSLGSCRTVLWLLFSCGVL